MSSKNIFELDPERLASTDEKGNRIYIYPEDVKGKWKDRRKIFYWFLIIVYLVLPWIYINGKPTIFLDIPNSEFTFFGSTLHGVEPLVLFAFIASGLFLVGFLTSLYGRIWCGWGCPQTVFIHSIFSKIDILFEGNARARRELDAAPWSLNKFLRRFGKWFVFTIISLHIAHTFIGYFVGPRELFLMTMHAPVENMGVFIATMILTTIFLLDFGWFREQFCIIACPYGRMQSVVMDENSLVVAYDAKRGEPRRGTPGVVREAEGDCINCYNCVKVCPTGIDIRRGTQLECIACTQCIDACDDIMTKLKKPTGLIKYSSELELRGEKRKTITVRSIIYAVITVILFGAFIYFLRASTNLTPVFIRSKTPFQVVKIESGMEKVINHFTLKISHQGGEIYDVNFGVKEADFKGKIEIVTPVSPTVLDKADKKIVLFFRFPKDILIGGTRKITAEIYDSESGRVLAAKEVILVGPVD